MKIQNEKAVLDFLNLKFGMFIHLNMSTYVGKGDWAQPGQNPKIFNPIQLDCRQWAKAAKSAKMNYAVLTTKHHDGFCLWDTSVTDYDISSGEFKRDIVKEYADAFREQDLKVGLYFSVWDRQHEIEHGKITKDKIEFTKIQLTELLTNYGEVICIVIDGWGSKWGNGPDFNEIPFETLADHIHSHQPDCLVINHSCKTDLSVTEIVHYEALHGQHCPFDNTIPSQQGPTLQPKWFWEPGNESLPLKSADDVLQELNFTNTRYCNYLLNAAPNDKGLMDANVVQRLSEIGAAVKLSSPLQELPQLLPVHQGVEIKASSEHSQEFTAQNLIDCDLFTRWMPSKNDTECTVELDFGSVKTFNKMVCGEFGNSVEKFKIEAKVGEDWKLLVEGKEMGHHFESFFDEIEAQYFRLTILKTLSAPKIAEITFVKY